LAQDTLADYFEGDVLVTGDFILVNEGGGDVVEDFDVEGRTSQCGAWHMAHHSREGSLCASAVPCDTRVLGVGNFRPAVVLQRVPSQKHRAAIALAGNVFCKVDATFGDIAANDLLTTSGTPGQATKTSHKSRARAVIAGAGAEVMGAGSLSARAVKWLRSNFLKTELELGHCPQLSAEGPGEYDRYLGCSRAKPAAGLGMGRKRTRRE
jgi:hypothetical protein